MTFITSDAIKQIKSEFECNENLIGHSIVCFHVRKTHPNWAYGSRDIAILVMLKTSKYKENWIILLALSKNLK